MALGGLGPGLSAASQEDWTELVCQPAHTWDCGKALRVLHCESRGDPRAYSAANYGLFQINAIHRARVGGNLELLYDPEVNIRVAHELYMERSWQPWAYCGSR